MSEQADLVIRGGTIVDGAGGEPFEGDIAICGDRILQVGSVAGGARRTIDARGLLVTPGFIDIHTHYDGQVTWSDRVSSSSWHGVTTAVMGNCGVGFAPCRNDHHEMLIHLMEGVEDIPDIVLAAGVPWQWQSFPEYLDFLAGRHFDINVATQLPHAALRVFVMGDRGARREGATAADLSEMRRLTAEAIRAGALGVSTSRTVHHRTSDGKAVPTYSAAETELTEIAMGMQDAGAGVLQMATDLSDWSDAQAEFAILRRVVEMSGRPLSIGLTQREGTPDGWRKVLDLIGEAARSGLPIKAQVPGRPIGLLLGLELSEHPFVSRPAYNELAALPLEHRIALMREPARKARILSEQQTKVGIRPGIYDYSKIFPMSDPPDYEPPAEASIASRAQQEGRSAEELVYDVLLENGGRTLLYRPLLNFSGGTLETCLAMLRDPHAVLGLGDGGAHCGLICDASITTFMLSHWVRDRSRGERLTLPRAVKAMTSDAARTVGLAGRGQLRQGYMADINIIDFDRLRLRGPEVAYDLPAGGKRLVQHADGYVATIVSGSVVYQNGVATDELPGRLLRGSRAT